MLRTVVVAHSGVTHYIVHSLNTQLAGRQTSEMSSMLSCIHGHPPANLCEHERYLLSTIVERELPLSTSYRVSCPSVICPDLNIERHVRSSPPSPIRGYFPSRTRGPSVQLTIISRVPHVHRMRERDRASIKVKHHYAHARRRPVGMGICSSDRCTACIRATRMHEHGFFHECLISDKSDVAALRQVTGHTSRIGACIRGLGRKAGLLLTWRTRMPRKGEMLRNKKWWSCCVRG